MSSRPTMDTTIRSELDFAPESPVIPPVIRRFQPEGRHWYQTYNCFVDQFENPVLRVVSNCDAECLEDIDHFLPPAPSTIQSHLYEQRFRQIGNDLKKRMHFWLRRCLIETFFPAATTKTDENKKNDVTIEAEVIDWPLFDRAFKRAIEDLLLSYRAVKFTLSPLAKLSFNHFS
jgi:hypothetical protein